MSVGTDVAIAIPEARLLDDYHTNLYSAYRAMRDAFATRGYTQDDLAVRLGVDKALISKRLNGRENLTLRTLSYMGSALDCRVTVTFTPYELIGTSNYNERTGTSAPNSVKITVNPEPSTPR
jgi:transcriptional regulator with XRE-family HTH domain